MDNEFQINLKPTVKEFKELEYWLIDEYQKFNEGFYCNWNIIENSFIKNEVITFKKDGKVVGFIVWSKNEKSIDIDIMEIHPHYREMGLGRILFKKFELACKKKGNLAIILFCEPRESEGFWRKMGFIKFPKRGWSESDLTFYKPLITIMEPVSTSTEENKIELWNVEPYEYESRRLEPRWCWNIEPGQKELQKPILQPCNRNWLVRWTRDGNVVIEDKIKYFSRNNSIENGPFMYIKKLEFS